MALVLRGLVHDALGGKSSPSSAGFRFAGSSNSYYRT
jgi:hypothetical protein